MRGLAFTLFRFAVKTLSAAAVFSSAVFFAAEPLQYSLDLTKPASHLVRVRIAIPDAPPRTEVQFPTWNCLYQIRDFVRNVQELRATCDGKQVDLDREDLNTWRSGEAGCARLELNYAVYAHHEGPFSATFDSDHAFLNFALLLFYLPLERDRAVRVRFQLPEGWRLATLLDGDGPEYSAENYDRLADSPAEAGEFKEFSYAQGSATYRVIVHADPADYHAEKLLASLRKITATETALMRDVPFRRYTFIFHFQHDGGGGMEHRTGTAISLPAAAVRNNPGNVEGTAAHEFFHLWNVKRIRPQALEPIDYVHGNDTRDLWFSEGVTSTYGQLTLLRAGLISTRDFYAEIAEQIRSLQERPARQFQSAELSGREAWLEKYPDYHRPERSISYYNKGELLGYLLDLVIRHASRNQASLDDVMRRLNQDFARRGRFFTLGDLRTIIASLAPSFTGLEAFIRDDVQGTKELEYETYLNYAGLHLAQEFERAPELGFRAVQNFDGRIQVESVEPESNAQKAGLEKGDILLKMDGRLLLGLPETGLLPRQAGQKAKLQVRRGERNFDIEYTLGVKEHTLYRVEEIPQPTPEQLQIRQGWLKGETEPRQP